MKKIALATESGRVAAHFGHCPEFTICDVEGDRVVAWHVIPNPGHKPGFLPRFLSEQGVHHIIAGGMGPAAINLFEERDIKVTTGVQGPVEEVIDGFLRHGRLESGPSLCSHGTAGHQCGGH